MKDTMKKEDKVNVNWYLVAFVDVLGQKNLLRNLRGLPANSEKGFEQFIHLLKETAGTVELLRKVFLSFFESYNKPTLDQSQLTEEQKLLYSKFKGNELKSHMFSDFVSLSLSLRDDENRVPMSGVYSTMVSAASVMLTMLSGKKVIRGGIDVGIGLELRNGDIYGSAVSRAYEIESKIAQYPRIVIGDDLSKYLDAQSKRTVNNPFDDMNRQLAQLCTQFIVTDEDGHPFLDYLGEPFKNDIAGQLSPEIVTNAYKFVVEQWLKFRSQKNSKLALRFMLLRDYFENHLHLWVEDPDKLMAEAQQLH
jgi:hypothetical protein